MNAKLKHEYIKSCNKGHYTFQKLKSLNWFKNPAKKDMDEQLTTFFKKDNSKNFERLRQKQEIEAKYNQMSRDNNKEWSKCEQGQYKYSVISGNNSGLVRRVLETREHWVELQEKYTTTLFSFKWSPVSRSCHFRYLGVNGLKNMVNHFERHD